MKEVVTDDIKCCRETEENKDPEGVVGTRELSVVT